MTRGLWISLAVLAGALPCVLLVAEAPASAGPRVVVGSVVDAARKRVPDASVVARFGPHVVRTTSGADGRFELEVPAAVTPPAGCAVVVRAAVDDVPFVAYQTAHLPVAPHPWPELLLRLRAEDPLTVRCTVDGAPAANVKGLVCSSRWSTTTPLAVLQTDAEGMLHVRLPRGQYKFVVTDARYAGTTHSIITPVSAREDLDGFQQPDLTFQRPRSVRVRVFDDASGAPIEDAYVVAGHAHERFRELVPDSPRQKTDGEGVTLLERIPRGMRVGIWAGTQDNASTGRVEIDADATEAEIRLTRGKTYTIRWPRPQGAATPPVGATMRFRADVHETSAVDRPLRMTEDAMVLEEYHDDSEYGYAVYEERVAAHLTYDLVRRRAADDPDPDGGSLDSVHRTTRFHGLVPYAMRVVDADGAGIEGALLYLEGRYLLPAADGRLTRGEHVTLVTDADGNVQGQGIFFQPAHVKLRGLPAQPGGDALGTLDPERDGAAPRVFTLPRVRDVEVRVTIDGERRLHADLSLTTLTMLGHARYDAEAATVRFRMLHQPEKGPPSFYAQLPGHHTHAETVEVPDEGTIVATMDLRSSVAIALQVDPESSVGPEDGVVELHHLDGESGAWVFVGDGTFSDGSVHQSVDLQMKGHPNWRAFTDLSAGTYRIVHTTSGLVQGPFTIDASKPVWDITLRLGTLPTVEGRVEGIANLRPGLAWILEPDGAPSLPWLDDEAVPLPYRTRADEEGRFELTLDDRAGGRYQVDHPLCEPAWFTVPEGSTKPLTVTLTPRTVLAIPIEAPTREHLLRASVNELLQFAFIGNWTPPFSDRIRHEQKARVEAPVRVLLRVETDGKASWEPQPVVWRAEDRTLLVPLEPGTHRLFLDLPQAVPVALHPVTVPREGRKLPARVPLPRGTRIRVKLESDAEDRLVGATLAAIPKLAEGQPPFERRSGEGRAHYEKQDLTEVATEGLPAGHYTLTLELTTQSGRKHTVTRDLRVDGTTALELGADLKPPKKTEGGKGDH